MNTQAITASSIVRMLEQSDSFGNRFSRSVQWLHGQGAALSLARIAKQLSHKGAGRGDRTLSGALVGGQQQSSQGHSAP